MDDYPPEKDMKRMIKSQLPCYDTLVEGMKEEELRQLFETIIQ